MEREKKDTACHVSKYIIYKIKIFIYVSKAVDGMQQAVYASEAKN
jgi:hypothetical protein